MAWFIKKKAKRLGTVVPIKRRRDRGERMLRGDRCRKERSCKGKGDKKIRGRWKRSGEQNKKDCKDCVCRRKRIKESGTCRIKRCRRRGKDNWRGRENKIIAKMKNKRDFDK
jgi:hypothetical protein